MRESAFPGKGFLLTFSMTFKQTEWSEVVQMLIPQGAIPGDCQTCKKWLCRAGAGITNHLSRNYDYSVIQTDIRCLRTYYIQVSWLNNVFWLYCINSYHLRAWLQLFKHCHSTVWITDHNVLLKKTQTLAFKNNLFDNVNQNKQLKNKLYYICSICIKWRWLCEFLHFNNIFALEFKHVSPIWNRLAQLAHSSTSSEYVLSHIIWFLTDCQVTSSYFCFIYMTHCFFVTRSSAFVILFSFSALSVAHCHPFLLRLPWGFWLLNILLGSFLIDVVAMVTLSACKHNWPANMYTEML